MTDILNAAAERFASDTANHTMTVLHDDGPYRHLRFNAAGTSFYWYDLVTWPGRLSVGGDTDGFVFARIDDMFEFFRNGSTYGINPSYWSEKIQDGRDRAKSYSEDRFNFLVADAVDEYTDRFPGLADEVRSELADYPTYTEDDARRFLNDFTYRTDAGQKAIDEAEAAWSATLRGTQSSREQKDAAHANYQQAINRHTFRFDDAWEWELRDWSWEFVWACHAIVTGIAQYDQHKDAQPAETVVELPTEAVAA